MGPASISATSVSATAIGWASAITGVASVARQAPDRPSHGPATIRIAG